MEWRAPQMTLVALVERSSTSRRDDRIAHRIQNNFRSIMQPQLLHQIRAVRIHCIRTQIQHRGRLLIRLSLRQQMQHFAFALRQQLRITCIRPGIFPSSHELVPAAESQASLKRPGRLIDPCLIRFTAIPAVYSY